MNATTTEHQWYFEVHVADPLGTSYWLRWPGVYPSFLAAQAAAMANDRRPYRIKSEPKEQR